MLPYSNLRFNSQWTRASFSLCVGHSPSFWARCDYVVILASFPPWRIRTGLPFASLRAVVGTRNVSVWLCRFTNWPPGTERRDGRKRQATADGQVTGLTSRKLPSEACLWPRTARPLLPGSQFTEKPVWGSVTSTVQKVSTARCSQAASLNMVPSVGRRAERTFQGRGRARDL